MNSDSRNQVDILGIAVDSLQRCELIQHTSEAALAGRRATVLYANAHVLNTAYRDRGLRDILNQADIVYCDGVGVRLAALLLGQRLPERMTGADWIDDLCAVCQDRNIALYLLGGETGIAARAASRLSQRYPDLTVAGTYHGFFDRNGAENEQVIAQINAARPQILLVGFGTPLQERWIAENAEKLDAPVLWAVGAVTDFVTGRQPRAPRWMLDHNLEWLGRLLSDPMRLWRRYIVGNPLFLYRVLRQRLKRG